MRTIAIIIVVALVMFTIINTLKTRTYKNLVSYLQQGKIKEFNQKIDSRSVKLLFPKSSLLDLKFNAAIVEQDKKNSKKYLDLINELPNDRMKAEANRVYNIYILKNDKYLKELLEELENMEDRQKGVNEYLISIIYKNKHDLENAKKYEELSKKHFALVDAETAEKYKK